MNTEILRSIGLSDNESKIYMCLLKSGPCLVSKIVSETGLNRTHVYDRLEKLIEKGVVNYVIRERRKYFNSTSPKSLVEFIEEKKRELESQKKKVEQILPELEKMKTKKEDVRVEVFEGIEGAKTILNNVIETGDTLRIWAWSGLFYEKFPVFYRNWIKRREKAGIKRRLLATEERKGLYQEKIPLTEIRYLPKNFNFPSSTWIYGDYVVIYISTEPITLVRIKNSTMSRVYKSTFEELWKISKK